MSYHNYEAFINHRIVSIVKALPTEMLSSFSGGAIAPAVPIAFPFLPIIDAKIVSFFMHHIVIVIKQ